jgi:(p)ppGpp synthase/HD superfamily hydrolase
MSFYSDRVDLALITAVDAHRTATRKIGLGYELSHVISVALIVSDHGFDEDAIVAAILHDTLEDTPLGREEIARRFGEEVLSIVEDVTEPAKRPGQPGDWMRRKTAYINQLRQTPRERSLAVASADKIHNITSLIRCLHTVGPLCWERFNATREEITWYQQAVLGMLSERWRHPILDRQARLVDALLAEAAKHV